jgi:hypothetical protein
MKVVIGSRCHNDIRISDNSYAGQCCLLTRMHEKVANIVESYSGTEQVLENFGIIAQVEQPSRFILQACKRFRRQQRHSASPPADDATNASVSIPIAGQ